MDKLKKLGMAFACTALVLACMVFAGVDVHAEEASVGLDGAAVVAEAPPEPVAEAAPPAEAAPMAETPAADPAPAPEEAALPAPAEVAAEAPVAVAAEAGAPQKVWWQNEDGVMRFYGDDGVARTGLFEVNGKQYWADATGAAQTGVFWDWPAGSIRYADPMSLELQTGLQWVGSDLYYFKDYLGVQGWTQLDGFDCYFGEYFTAPNGVTEIANDGTYYFENGRSAGDWFQAAGDDVYFFGGGKGKAVTNFFTVGENAYFGWDDGRLASDLFWDWPMGSVRYGDPVGYQLHKGWVDFDHASYYFNDNYLALRDGTFFVDDAWRYFNQDGWATEGIVEQDGKTYYYHHGQKAGDWFTAVDGKVYFFGGEGGSAVTGFFTVGDKAYFGGADGALMSDFFWDWPAGGKRYGDLVSYELYKGWMETSHGTYYFKPDYVSAMGWNDVDGINYYFDTSSGVLTHYQEPTPTNPTTPEDPLTAHLRGQVQRVVELVNHQRALINLQPLTIIASLSDLAAVRNTETYTLFEHTRPDGRAWNTVFGDYGYTYDWAGENLAYGYESAEQVMDGWMSSQGHRENILREVFTEIGVAVGIRDDGRWYWTQLFGDNVKKIA